ncbi:AAA family ATPase [Planococcus sp. CPCC 101016]|uniref:ATP-binding protein n=1 Tax=Planococcus sp. CPCC 101016 TaxID=2599617 RepID=UPI0011B3DA94|nr:AAA family ATPase [Planococcus sp. CPCC 101016]TWT03367.1 AAA family ATPase [Planococcus sp. CPCC 101016]
MRIEKMIIYGFGKHENRTIDLTDQMALFYGPNEAGKTTMQQFIVQVLFGFPSRKGTQLRYEPKNGGKYGGKLHITDAHYGKLVVERVKGKSAGDVTIWFEDGRKGAEPELKQLLRNYDRTAFEAVFSFSIHELQGLEGLSEAELSRTLLASGTTGVDAVTHLESRLEKEMAVLFKKGGRNPEMNVLADELRDTEGQLKEYRQRAELYSPYIERLQEIDRRLVAIETEEAETDRVLRKIAKWQQATPLLTDKKNLTEQIEALQITQFPLDGKRQMDRLVDKLSETRADGEHLARQQESLLVPEAPASVEALENLLSRESDWHQLSLQLEQKRNEQIELLENRQTTLSLLGLAEQQAMEVDISLNNEEKLVAKLKDLDVEEEDKRFRQRNLENEKNKLKQTENELTSFLSGEPSGKERLAAEQWPTLSAKLAEAKAASKIQTSGNENGRIINYMLIALGLALAAFGFAQSVMVLVVLGLATIGSAIWLFLKTKKPGELPQEYQAILKEHAGKESEYEAISKKVAEFDRHLDGLMAQRDAIKKNIAAYSSEAHQYPAKDAYQQLLQEIGLQAGVSRTMVLELFEKLRHVQAVHSRLLRIDNEIRVLEGRQKDWIEKAESACGKELATGELMASLRSELAYLRRKQEEWVKIKEKQAGWIQEMNRLTAYREQLEKEQQALLEYADAQDVFDFYRLTDEWEQKQQLMKELALVEVQLQSIGNIELPTGWEPDQAEQQLDRWQASLTKLKNERNELLAEQADKQQMTRLLVSDTSYEEKLQEFEEKKAEFAELANEWSVNKAIVEAINRTMDELKEKKLPAVLDTAQLYFSKLTAGAYQGLVMNINGYFEAERQDGMYFRIAELSQATKEQAYLALRLSLAVSMQKSHPFPIIMDDAFVHFDRSRLQQMINLVTELQREHQFIYFTCHESMQQAWPNAQIIKVANTERSVHS